MVKLIQGIQQNNLPTISNSFSPNPLWRNTDSFDYTQYYDKKRGSRTFQQARNKDACKPDENFRVDNSSNFFYNFTDYRTRTVVGKYYKMVRPYCQMDSENPTTTATGQDIYNNTIAIDGIAGKTSTTPVVPGGGGERLKPTQLNQIKGAVPFNQCVSFKNGFNMKTEYSFRF